MQETVIVDFEFHADDLIEEARRRTGLQDLGDDRFRPNLERLLASINAESGLSEYGVAATRELLLKPLITRLNVEAIHAQHPEIESEEIIAPAIVVGLPRTGSTLLGFLLGLDPASRPLRYWESVIPYPPMLPGEEDAQRIADADLVHKQMRDLIPEILPMTPYDPRGPAECFELTQLSFDSNYALWLNCPSYMEWYIDPESDHSGTYFYHRRVLKMLQWRWRNVRWSLRCPLHSFALPDLVDAYPDAKLIMTHREPVKVIPSISFQSAGVRTMFLADPLSKQVGPAQTRMWERALKSIRGFRRDHEAMFSDVLHAATTSEPVDALRQLYDDLGWRFTESYAQSVRDWKDQHPRVRTDIDLADYGLNDAELEECFDFYRDDPVLGFKTARERWEGRSA